MTGNKKGFTLLEMMVGVAIILIMSGIGITSFKKRSEKNDLLKMKNQIPIFFENICERSYEKGERYRIICDFSNKIIKIKEEEKEDLIDKLNLSSGLIYTFVNSKKEITNEVSRKTTDKGNINKGFSVYIFNKSGKALYKLSFSNNAQSVNFIRINRSLPLKKIVIKNFSSEHKLTESEEKIMDYNSWTLEKI